MSSTPTSTARSGSRCPRLLAARECAGSSSPARRQPARIHAITPSRAYDSRKTAYTVNGPLAPNTNRVVSLADSHTDGGRADHRQRRARRRHRGRGQPHRVEPDQQELPRGRGRQRDVDADVAAELGPRRHPDRQLDHRAARRDRARSRCSAATRPAAPTSSSTSSATTSDHATSDQKADPVDDRSAGSVGTTRRIPPSAVRSGGSTRPRTPSAGCG